jgi:hypothetical protein
MSCCNSKREAMQQRRTISTVPIEAVSTPESPRTPILFQGTGEYLAAGQHSGHIYRFSTMQRQQWIDAKDVEALLTTGLFQKGS